MNLYIGLASLIIMTLSSATIVCVADKKVDLQQMTKILVSSHTRAFSKDNLLFSGIQQDESSIWHETIGECTKFVNSRTKKFKSEMEKLTNISNALVDSVKAAYNGYVAGKDKSKINIQKISELISPLASSKTVLANINKSLEKSKSIFDSSGTKDARTLALRLTDFLDATTDKILRDLKKIDQR